MKNKPFILYNVGMSLDGKICTSRGESAFSSEEDLDEVHEIRAKMDGIMVGINTVLNDNPRLTVRRGKETGKTPWAIVVDSKARLPLKSRLFQSSRPIVVGTTDQAPKEKIEKLHERCLIFQRGEKEVIMPDFLQFLHHQGIKNILLEGGGTLAYSLITQGLVDEIRVAISPVILGSEGGVSLLEGPGFVKIKNAVRLSLFEEKKLGKSVVLHYQIVSPKWV